MNTVGKESSTKRRGLMVVLLLTLCFLTVHAQHYLDSLRSILRDAPVQEKVYLHIDNNCYFKGDTIWYKAYVVRADDLTYTNMSRILYVELLSPHGTLVERQSIILSKDFNSYGNFQLKDSLYSGYYELRAYTRYMLNFDVTEHKYWENDEAQFYNKEMAKDFFRMYDALYSRVVPVYEKPETKGDYTFKYFLDRPKQELPRKNKDRLEVNFYPEGGHLIAGTRCRVAYEALNVDGASVDVTGTLNGEPLSTIHQGRGVVDVDVPESGSLSATFKYDNKENDFRLPKAEKTGCALRLDREGDDYTIHASLRGLPTNAEYIALVLCRGMLKWSDHLVPDNEGNATLRIGKGELPTGVCDLLIIDGQGAPLADRLFFVDNHDYTQQAITVEGDDKEFAPYELVSIDLHAPADARTLSIAVRDNLTDEPTYDTGNILVDLLLCSELKGYVPHPDYYFEADDAKHRQALDLLMMVQGWRRYDYHDLIAQDTLRYTPETHITVEGNVYKTVYFSDDRDYSDQYAWSSEFENSNREGIETPGGTGSGLEKIEKVMWDIDDVEEEEDPASSYHYSKMKKEVTIESELLIDKQFYSGVQSTSDGGAFTFDLPAFYGKGILTFLAYKTGTSEEKIHKLKMKDRLDEDKYPNYYVKRNLFYPIFTQKYSYYQCHHPNTSKKEQKEYDFTIPEGERLSPMDKVLDELKVKGKKRHGRQEIDFTKPLCSYDAVETYNLLTDYGLSYGKFHRTTFAKRLLLLFLGNMNMNRSINFGTHFNYYTEYLYSKRHEMTEAEKDSITTLKIRALDSRLGNLELKLKRLKRINIFSDFDPRYEDRTINSIANDPDLQTIEKTVTIDYVTLLDDMERPTFRERWIIIDGFYEPDDFYHPNYMNRPLDSKPEDYRRTLYWNPCARLDENGNYHARFFNNSKATRVVVSAAGLTKEGKPVNN